ncbi:hypothetical protein GDO81_027054, partial [Engystomops pustulosus]
FPEQPRRWYILSIISLLVILMVGIILLMWKIRRKRHNAYRKGWPTMCLQQGVMKKGPPNLTSISTDAKEDEAVEYYLEEVPTPESSTNTIQVRCTGYK